MIKIKQPSTWKGFVLIASVLAIATGNGDIFNAEVTENGFHIGGTAGVLITAVMGLWETFRNEEKSR
ncbi:hypothetical protein CV742_17970 [Vibrio parahaemolyticus]|nr:hypothetical protein [Vibrio parahaemolyticus]